MYLLQHYCNVFLLASKQLIIYCKTKLYLVVPGRQGKHAYAQDSLQGRLSDIIEQETFILDCKHKHMKKKELHLTNSDTRIDF